MHLLTLKTVVSVLIQVIGVRYVELVQLVDGEHRRIDLITYVYVQPRWHVRHTCGKFVFYIVTQHSGSLSTANAVAQEVTSIST